MEESLRLRYARQIAVPEIGKCGQQRLREAKVLIIGCGALGSMVAMQLAAAGVGELGIADFDNVDISNLQRQFFFITEDAGKSKVELIRDRIKSINPEVNVVSYKQILTSGNSDSIFQQYDFIVDGTDNPETKRMTGELSKRYGKGCCIGGVRDFGGQVMTFLPTSPRFEDYFGIATSGSVLPCSLGGVMGQAAALCATIQASETIKYITGSGELLAGSLLTFNLLNNSFKVFEL